MFAAIVCNSTESKIPKALIPMVTGLAARVH